MINVDELRSKLKRQASVMTVSEKEFTGPPGNSWFGRVTMAAPGQEWPMSNGKAMLPLCQIDCSELPYRPDILDGIAFITVCISIDDFPGHNTLNGNGWLLRSYTADDVLVPIAPPPLPERPRSLWNFVTGSKSSYIKPSPISWDAIDDYPDYLDAVKLYPEIESLGEEYDEHFDNCFEGKIGGWPTQSLAAIFEGYTPEPEFVFQLANEPEADWFWGDMGIASFGRIGSENSWNWIFDMNYS